MIEEVKEAVLPPIFYKDTLTTVAELRQLWEAQANLSEAHLIVSPRRAICLRQSWKVRPWTVPLCILSLYQDNI